LREPRACVIVARVRWIVLRHVMSASPDQIV
jgi:hypothetical protein